MQAPSRRPHVAAGAAMALWLSWERHQSKEDTHCSPPPLCTPMFYPPLVARCEGSVSAVHTDLVAPSWLCRTLASCHLATMPFPRRLLPTDSVFNDAALKRGLRQRQRDDRALIKLQPQAAEALQSGDQARARAVFEKVSEIAYGKGVTPQMRENFVMRFGCTGWTEQVLDALVDLAESRGIVEIGAGNGQWARALSARYLERALPNKRKNFDFVLAFDDMSELPLSPEIYHSHTQPANDYFYNRVQKMDNDVQKVLQQWSCRGRVLLLVYPPPGPMALDTVRTYVELGPENDTVVYVGEGRNGANGNDALFDFLESGDWAIVQVLSVNTPPGGKGYEKMYILRRIKSELEEKECSD